MRALTNVLVVAGVVIAGIFALVLGPLGGWSYYRAPLGVRGYTKWHPVLRPSGSVGEFFGIVGVVLILLTMLYVVRKKLAAGSRLGSLKVWLEYHVFFGLVGPALITLHGAFKFSGIISVAYWSMVLVVLSGFVGRYLFVRIPKTIRGTELSLSEIQERAAELAEDLGRVGLPPQLLQRIEGLEEAAGAHRPRWRRLRRDMRRAGVARGPADEAIRLVRDRAMLLRRMAMLGRTKKLFELWHVFHKPLVYLMVAIAAVHIGLAIYFGYSFPRH